MSKETIKRVITPSEYDRHQHYPPRIRWHVAKTLEGIYGAVISDMRSLPVVDESDLQQLQETHNYLTRYYTMGADDPARADILMMTGRTLMRMLRANASHIEQTDHPWSTRSTAIASLRNLGLTTHDIPQLIDKLVKAEYRSKEYFSRLDQLFGLVWTSLDLDESIEQALRSTVLAPEAESIEAQTIAAALFVGCMEYFDPRKIMLLLSLRTQHRSPVVRGAALAALLILGRRHQQELRQLHPDIVEAVNRSLLTDEKQLLEAIKVIHISYKTTDNHKVFREKILPELKSISDKLQQVMGGSLSNRIEELTNGGIDPDKMAEVEQLMAKAPDQLSILKDGEQDVSFHLTSELKGFEFFSSISHWFMPFTEDYPALSKENVAAFKSVLPMMLQGQRLISSDLYSYAFIPAWQQVAGSISAQMAGQPMPDTPLSAPSVTDGVREFVFGAYRFYMLSSMANTLVNPFTDEPYIIDGAFLSDRGLLSESGLLRLATMMVGFGQYRSAGRTYERVVADHLTDTAEVWRGMSVASLMRNDDEKALHQLHNAIRLEGKSEMTVQKIAQILNRLGRKQEAVKWLTGSEEELEEVSYRLPLLRAMLAYELGQTDAALKAIYKADYLAEGKVGKVTVLLAELLLQSGSAEKAAEALSRVDESGQILLWKGLTALASGHRPEGLQSLKAWVANGSQGPTLTEKLPLLGAYGIAPWEQALIQDIIYKKDE